MLLQILFYIIDLILFIIQFILLKLYNSKKYHKLYSLTLIMLQIRKYIVNIYRILIILLNVNQY